MSCPDGEVVTGKTTDADGRLLRRPAQRPEGAWRGIDHELHLISPEAIEPIQAVKVNHLGSVNPRLHTDETLIALAISRHDQPAGQAGAGPALRACGAARPTPPSSSPRWIAAPTASLGLRLTCEPQYETNKLYHK